MLRILLVDDHDDTLRVLARLLEMSGFAVRTAESGRRAKELAQENWADLLISDIGLPDVTGIELMRDLRAAYGIPGIALTGFQEDFYIQDCLTAGFSRHLVKPVDLDALVRAINEVAPPPSNPPQPRLEGCGKRD